MRNTIPDGWHEIDSCELERPGKLIEHPDPYAMKNSTTQACATQDAPETPRLMSRSLESANTVIRLPSFEQVKADPVLYAHASRLMHLETNPGNARALVQRHGNREVWLNPPPIPLTTEEIDFVFGLPYSRTPHHSYGKQRIPAYEMIKHSVNIMRGCFGGCTFTLTLAH